MKRRHDANGRRQSETTTRTATKGLQWRWYEYGLIARDVFCLYENA